MWLSEKTAQRTGEKPGALCGNVTISEGNLLAATVDGEWRDLNVYSPRGFFWKPKLGEAALVIKAGSEGEGCVTGQRLEEPSTLKLEPEDVALYSQDESAGVILRKEGKVEIKGGIVTVDAAEGISLQCGATRLDISTGGAFINGVRINTE